MKGLVEVQKEIVLRQFVQGSAAIIGFGHKEFLFRDPYCIRATCNFKKVDFRPRQSGFKRSKSTRVSGGHHGGNMHG